MGEPLAVIEPAQLAPTPIPLLVLAQGACQGVAGVLLWSGSAAGGWPNRIHYQLVSRKTDSMLLLTTLGPELEPGPGVAQCQPGNQSATVSSL